MANSYSDNQIVAEKAECYEYNTSMCTEYVHQAIRDFRDLEEIASFL
ncbi:MAG TPA: hypothetical protein VJ799_08810 [Nitrososphaeraceae archaeon]|nr:hypothetical protein [Nitrososphaeraceae archaeon]